MAAIGSSFLGPKATSFRDHVLAFVLLLWITIANASPVAEPQPAATPLTSPHSSPYFRLQSRVQANGHTSSDRFNNLIVGAKHVGAGANTIVLTSGGAGVAATTANLTDGHLLFQVQSNFLWPMIPRGVDFGTRWTPINANALGFDGLDIDQYPQYFFEGGLLKVNMSRTEGGWSYSWSGWRVCDWWYGTPQLFWDLSGSESPLLATCAMVDLVRISSS